MSASRRKPARRGSKPSKVFAPGLDYLRDGFVARCDTQAPFHRLHCHDDIEVAVNQHSSVVAMFGRRAYRAAARLLDGVLGGTPAWAD